MQQSSIYEICGIIASVAMILGYLPQAIKTIRTIWSLFLTNLITAICSSIVFAIKMYNDYFKKK